MASVAMPASADLPFRLPLAVSVVWHPQSAVGRQMAEWIFKGLCADPDLPMRRRAGMSVRFLTSLSADQRPLLPASEGVDRSMVFVVCDPALSAAGDWRDYLAELAAAPRAHDRLVPVAVVEPRLIPRPLAAFQAIQAHEWPQEQVAARLLIDVTHDVARLLADSIQKVRVFVSHAKSDGADIAVEVCRHLREEARLDDFFDARDIPDGSHFAEEIKNAAGGLSALLAIQTDSYASREWCRLEVLEAKAHRVPVVVLGAVEQEEVRSFPYLGNVPSIRWHGAESFNPVVAALLREVVMARYFPLRTAGMDHVLQAARVSTLAQPPELLTALLHRSTTITDGGRDLLVYPDPPLGSAELKLLHRFVPEIDPVTPTILLARSGS